MENILKAHGIMFHHFHGKNHIECQGSLSAEKLEEILEFYKEQGYRIISAEEFQDKCIHNKIKENEVVLTFDDALKCQYDIAYPVLQQRGLTAYWFIYTSPICGVLEKLEVYHHFRFSKFRSVEEFYSAFFELISEDIDITKYDVDFSKYLPNSPFYTFNDRKFRYIRDQILGEEKFHVYMDQMLRNYNYDPEKYKDVLWMKREEIKVLSETGNVIGLHSHTHPTKIASYTKEEQLQEYALCKKYLEEITGTAIEAVSYPCNSYNEDTEGIMNMLGIQIGFCADMSKPFENKLFIPREDSANIIRKMKEYTQN